MHTNISLFDYDLPARFIAQTPAEPRDASKLLVLNRATGAMTHCVFRDLVDLLRPDDVLVFNVSKVFKARLRFDEFEVFVLRIRDNEIDALVRPGKKIRPDKKCPIGQFISVLQKSSDGIVTFETGMTADEMLAYCDAHGEVPTPPYVTSTIDADRYQTVYAKHTGSVAAPTAGLHFTPELLDRIRAKGVQIEEVTLHVGIGTFRPVQTATLEEHVMHSEFVSIDAGTAERISAAKAQGRRIIAVGTTTVRVLEGVVKSEKEKVKSGLRGYSGEVNLFITPGFDFKIVDGLITNFHLPKSTLLVLVSAFAGLSSGALAKEGREHVLAAYEEAKAAGYRFFSFGDAMFIA